nr:hypothetical protein [Nevskia ramosa]
MSPEVGEQRPHCSIAQFSEAGLGEEHQIDRRQPSAIVPEILAYEALDPIAIV